MKILNFKRKNSKRGFTLIELLIVIAIIGVLSSIIFSSLANAKAKTNDSKVKQLLTRVRNSIAIYQDNNGSYTGSTMSPANPCTGLMFTDVNSRVNDYTGTASAWPSGTLLSCQATASQYAISANLQASGLPAATDHWCVDSAGISKAIAGQLTTTQFSCP